MSTGGIVFSLLIAIPVIVGVVAGIVSTTANQPTTYSWSPTHQSLVFNQQEENIYFQIEEMVTDDELSIPIGYEISIPNEKMEAGIEDLLKAVSSGALSSHESEVVGREDSKGMLGFETNVPSGQLEIKFLEVESSVATNEQDDVPGIRRNKDVYHAQKSSSKEMKQMEIKIDELLTTTPPLESKKEVLNDSVVFDELTHLVEKQPYELAKIIDSMKSSDTEEERNVYCFDNIPTILEAKDYYKIVQAFDPTVVAQITTTSAEGGSSQMGDIMIGRLDQNAVGTVQIILFIKGQIREELMGRPVMISGQFGSPEEFSVSYMVDPVKVGSFYYSFFL